MMKLDPALADYISRHSTTEDKILADLDRQTNLDTLHPQMIAGHLQGKILEMLSRMIQPDNILEIGTFTGYSAICLAKGLKENGHLYTIEINDELKEIASRFISLAGFAEKITLLRRCQTNHSRNTGRTIRPGIY